jgi:hypothetical protein
MSRRNRRPSPFGPPPINEGERTVARQEAGVVVLKVSSWHATAGSGDFFGGKGGFVQIGSDAKFREAERIAAKRTAETN